MNQKANTLLDSISSILEDKKAVGLEIVEISNLSSIADYFVICSGTSNTHIKALADELVKKTSEKWWKPFNVEGYETGRWILLDYGEVIVHIFHNDDRHFYNLEKLWIDAKRLRKENIEE